MRWSLEPRRKTFLPTLTELGVEDASGIGLDDGRHVVCRPTPADDLSDRSWRHELERRGFVPCARAVRWLVDLAGVTDYDSYLQTLNKSHRHRLGQLEAQLWRQDASADQVFDLTELDPAKLATIYRDVVQPAASSRSMDPYGISKLENFHLRLAHLSRIRGDTLCLVLESRSAIVGLALFVIAPKRSLAQERWSWRRPISDDEVCLELDLVLVAPEHHALTPILFARTLRIAIERKATIWSGGADDMVSSGSYLGVIGFKRKWGSSPCACVDPTAPTFIRVSPRRSLLDAVDLHYLHAGDEGMEQVLFFADRAEHQRLLLRRESDPPQRILVANDVERDYWRKEISKRSLAGGIHVERLAP